MDVSNEALNIFWTTTKLYSIFYHMQPSILCDNENNKYTTFIIEKLLLTLDYVVSDFQKKR